MGDRNCAFEGCNALEFRTTGFCLNHKDGQFGVSTSMQNSDPPSQIPQESKKEDSPLTDPGLEGLTYILTLIMGTVFAITSLVYPPMILFLVPFYLLFRRASKDEFGSEDKNLQNVPIRDDDIIATHENSVEPHLRRWDTEDGHAHEFLDVNPQSPISILMNEEGVGRYLIFCLGLAFFFIFLVFPTFMWDPCFGFPGSEPCP